MRMATSQMSIHQFFTVFKARWRLALLVQLTIVALVYGVSSLLPPRYTASASVLVDVKAIDPVAGTSVEGPMLAAYMANEANIVQSERVMLHALKSLGLLEDREYQARWIDDTDGSGDFGVWLVNRLSRDLEIRPAREGSVITVQFSSTRRELAAQMVNALVSAYIETALALKTEPAQQFTRFFDERARTSLEAVQAAQRRLSSFQQSRGIVVTDERLDVETARLADLSAQLTSLQAAATESGSRQRESRRRVDVSPEVLASPLLGQLNDSLTQQEMRLLELESRLTNDHPQVIDQRASIKLTRSKIRSESQRVLGGLGVVDNINRSRVEGAAAALAAQRAKLLLLKGERDEVAVLQHEVENTQKAYDAAVARLNQSDLESRARQSNVSMLAKASIPSRASSPKIALNTAVAMVLGALFAVAAVFLRELADRKLRTLEDVVQHLGLPLLAVMPPRQKVPAKKLPHTRGPLARRGSTRLVGQRG